MSVFSNGDPQSLNKPATGLGIPVDRAISAEQARFYKSDSRAYHHAIKELGTPGAQAAYAADHSRDIRGTRPVGMAGACINRYEINFADFDDSRAALEVSGSAGLGNRLT